MKHLKFIYSNRFAIRRHLGDIWRYYVKNKEIFNEFYSSVIISFHKDDSKREKNKMIKEGKTVLLQCYEEKCLDQGSYFHKPIIQPVIVIKIISDESISLTIRGVFTLKQ